MKRLLAMLMLAGGPGLVGLVVSPAQAANGTEPAPLVKAAEFKMMQPRFGAAMVAQGDFLYIVGGSSRATWVLPSVERLNLRTGRAEPFAQLRVGRLSPGAVLVGNRIYVLGGVRVGARIELEDTVEVVDLAGGAVSEAPRMPRARHSFACVEWDGRIYVIGGQWQRKQQVVETNTMAILDLATGQWSDGVPMPKPRQCAGAVVSGGFIVVAGGYNGQRQMTEVDVFNPRDRVWRSLPPLSRSVSSHAIVFGGRSLFILGDREVEGSLLTYDLAAKQSREYRLDERVARGPAAVGHENRIYVAGGMSPTSPDAFDSVLAFELTR